MTRDELISMMQDVLAGPDAEAPDYPFDASAIAQAALTAIEAAGLCIVPREATQRQIRSAFSCGDGDPHYVYGAMVKAGRI